jgi:hypothetical protein
MRKENNGSLVFVVIGLALQGAAWLWPNAPIEVRAALSIFSVLLVIFVQVGRYEEVRAWFTLFKNLWVANYPLIVAAVFAGAGIIALSTIGETSLTIATRLIMTGLLAACISVLILGQSRRPSIRVVKGSSDKVYLIEDGVKRHIPEPLTLLYILLDTYCDIERISDSELNLYREGNILPTISSCELVKGSGPEIYVIWEGHRKHIPDPPTLEQFFHGRIPRELSAADLEGIPRTGTLRSILSFQPTITIQGNVENLSIGNRP